MVMNEKEKIVSSSWWIAIVLLVLSFLISGIPVLVVIIPLSFMGPALPSISALYSNLLLQSVAEIAQVVGLWLGVRYAARYVLRSYQIPNAARVTILATIYMVSFMILNFITGIYIIYPRITSLLVFTYLIGDALACIAVYYSCKRYLRNTSESIPIMSITV